MNIKYKVNDRLHGFVINRIRENNELDGVLYEMTYEKNGASLCWFDRDDDNKTFAVAFKTIPENDTGVFHILEHSVLCGSDKYPVREPFVELLKGSLQTFLNAFTFPDKTMYPVCSKNEKDFLNLVDVYMDAVLHPAILKNENIFRQEGWHFELENAADRPSFNGVVFNEMKGDYSSADSQLVSHLTSLLYPDNCYGKESGGEPTAIPTLTYEYFLDCHRRYYHPSNTRFFIDGRMDLDKILGKLDGFLSPYDFLEINTDIPDQSPVGYKEYHGKYEVTEQDGDNKSHIALGYSSSRFDQPEITSAISIITEYLCGSNESVLKKELLERGLCDDVYFNGYDGIAQNFLILEVRNTSCDKLDEIKNTIKEVIGGIVKDGFDGEMLTAIFNNYEFRTRERDFGTFPKGLVFALASMDSWLYGGDPMQNLLVDDMLASLRSKLGTDYYTKLLSDTFLDNPSSACVLLEPSSTMGQERIDAENAVLDNIKASWTETDIQKIIEDCASLHRWQGTPDSAEALATLPSLELSDISRLPKKRNPIIENIGTCDCIVNSYINTNGIVYADVLFPLPTFTPEEITALSFACSLLGRIGTDSHGSLELQNIIRRDLGSIGFTLESYAKKGEESFTPYLRVSASALKDKKDRIYEIAEEILSGSDFSDKKLLISFIRQFKLEYEESIASAGHSFAVRRSKAYVSAQGAFTEYCSGIEVYRWLKKYDSDFDMLADTLIDTLGKLLNSAVSYSYPIVSVTGEDSIEFVKRLASLSSSDTKREYINKIEPLGILNEGIIVPAGVCFAGKSAFNADCGVELDGQLLVGTKLVSLGYLWNAVRVQGGAYGVGFSAGETTCSFYSYRDPNGANTLDCYNQCGAFLREFASSDEELTKFIIGVIGESEPVMSPRFDGYINLLRFMTGKTYEDVCKTRAEILDTTKADLNRIADELDKINAVNAYCLIGGKDKIDAAADKLKTIFSI